MNYRAHQTFSPDFSAFEPLDDLASLGDTLLQPSLAPRVALMGTFPPQRCGIATFTADILASLRALPGGPAVDVYALGTDALAPLPDDVTARISTADPGRVGQAAATVNAAGPDVVWLQHEFGIFDGPDGERVLELVQGLAAPLIVTFHTVLREPSANQRRIVHQLLDRARRVMVMNQSGRDLLVEVYGAQPDSLVVIPHGAPDRPFIEDQRDPAHPCLMTFGLIGPGKGLEAVIAALPAIRDRHPGVLYRIIGMTHPNLIAHEGERYREGLMQLARDLGVDDTIVWENRFLDNEELLDQLQECDIYLTPYPGLQQSTSGTLSYAVALGKAIVSTPYVHAREILCDGAGVLVPPDDSKSIADAVIGLLDDPARRQDIRRRAYARGRQTLWPVFARSALAMVKAAMPPVTTPAPFWRPPAKEGLLLQCDDVGILQHGHGGVPDRSHGYCVDDNARALIAMHDMAGLTTPERRRWSFIFASFIQHAWNPETQAFRNFMAYDRTWLEERGSDDSYGRTLWALGATAERAPEVDLRLWGRRLFDQALGGFATVESPRALALAAQGAASVLRAEPAHIGARLLLERTGRMLTTLLQAHRRPRWPWFEVMLAYDNPRLPLALILAGEALGRTDWVNDGLETLEWIAMRQTSAVGHFRPVGSEGMGQPGVQLPFDQQPLEAQAMIEAAGAAWRITGKANWQAMAMRAWQWFFGANDRGVIIGDLASGRCRDGVTPQGANINCGAESVLALHQSWCAMAALVEGADSRKSGGMDEATGHSISSGHTRPKAA